MKKDPYLDMKDRIAPEVLERFLEASEDYGETFRELGLKGQFSDIYRKIGKLKRSIWDGHELKRESPREIAGDIIGHCLIIMYLYDEGELP